MSIDQMGSATGAPARHLRTLRERLGEWYCVLDLDEVASATWSTTDIPADARAVVLVDTSNVLLAPAGHDPDPGRPCPVCVARRWGRARGTADREAHATGQRTAPAAYQPNPWLVDVLRALTAPGYPTRAPARGVGTVLRIHAETLDQSTFDVLVDPGCDCTAAQDEDYAPPELTSQPKSSVDEYHALPLGELELPRDALTGRQAGTLCQGLRQAWTNPVSIAVTGTLREPSIFGTHTLEFGMSGHGRTLEESARTAMLEGLERHSGLARRRGGPMVAATLRELGDTALDPALLGTYPQDHFLPAHNRLGHVPWSADLPIEWVAGLSLTSREPRWVPEQMVHYLARSGRHQFLQDNSNGCAIGSGMAEAVLAGLFEVIERDAFLVHWFARQPMPRIVPTRGLSAEDRTLTARLDALGFELFLFDARVDLPIPAVVAVARRRTPGPGRIAVAAGASLSHAGAIHAAIREVAFNAPLMEALYRGQPRRAESLVDDYGLVEELGDHTLLYTSPRMEPELSMWLDGGAPALDVPDTYATWRGEQPRHLDLVDDVNYLVETLRGHGMETVVAEQTSLETQACGLRAFKVFVPGLLPIDFGHRSQRALSLERTRTVLHRVGRRARPVPAADLNLVPHPFP